MYIHRHLHGTSVAPLGNTESVTQWACSHASGVKIVALRGAWRNIFEGVTEPKLSAVLTCCGLGRSASDHFWSHRVAGPRARPCLIKLCSASLVACCPFLRFFLTYARCIVPSQTTKRKSRVAHFLSSHFRQSSPANWAAPAPGMTRSAVHRAKTFGIRSSRLRSMRAWRPRSSSRVDLPFKSSEPSAKTPHLHRSDMCMVGVPKLPCSWPNA